MDRNLFESALNTTGNTVGNTVGNTDGNTVRSTQFCDFNITTVTKMIKIRSS